jgi:nitroreductase
MTATTERGAESLHCTACSHSAKLDPDLALERAVESALRAPSAYNTQPWRFRLLDGTLELHADVTRGRQVADPANRELYLACGAALANMRVTIRHLGREADIAILPDRARPHFVARVRVGAVRHPTLADSRYFTAIPQRRSNRARFYSRPIPLGVGPSLAQAVEGMGASLRYLYSANTRDALGEIITFADRVQAHDAKFRLELAAWLRGNQTDRLDGMPGFAFGLSAPMAALAPFALHALSWDSIRVVRDDELAREAPLLGVLLTRNDEPREWIMAGEGMERALLFASSQGLATGFMNQAIQVPEARERVRRLLNTTWWPLAILRFGFGPETRQTARRAVTDVLVRDQEMA